MKIRVLASPFQLELIRRMGGSPIAMTLADVLPGLQQGTIDGTLTTMTIYTTMHYDDAGKYVIKNDQPYVNSIGVMSKKWMDTLPPDLQKVVRDAGAKVTAEITPFVKEFFAEQIKIWGTRGGEIVRSAEGRVRRDDRQGLHHRRRPVEVEAGAERGGEGGVRIGGAQQVAASAARRSVIAVDGTAPGRQCCIGCAGRRERRSNRRLLNDRLSLARRCASWCPVLRVAGRRAAGLRASH